LRGVYHPRIIHPQLDAPASADVVTRPITQFNPRQNPELPGAIAPDALVEPGESQPISDLSGRNS
jgi:hypothetical protein